MNFDRMYQAMVHDAKAGEGSNKIVYWSRLFDWKNQTLTPNPDSIYLMAFFNTKDVGPVVLEIPPADGGSITGSIDDCRQTAIEDVGPAGLDKGKGGKYLILPPGYKDKPPAGYIPLQAYNYEGYALLRSILKSNSEADVAKAVAYGKRIKLYSFERGFPSSDTAQSRLPPRILSARVHLRISEHLLLQTSAGRSGGHYAAKTEMIRAGVGIAFAAPANLVATAVLIGAEKRAATVNFLRNPRFAGIEAVSRALRVPGNLSAGG